MDNAGNQAETKTREVIVSEDNNGDTVVISEGYFETGWDTWTDGGSDSKRYEGNKSPEGNFSIRLRDDSRSSKMTSEEFDLSPYSKIDISFMNLTMAPFQVGVIMAGIKSSQNH